MAPLNNTNTQTIDHFWSLSPGQLFRLLDSSPEGLDEPAAARRLRLQGSAKRPAPRWRRDLALLLAQYKSPLVLLLVVAVGLSLLLHEYSDSLIILAVLMLTGIMGFVQERNAGRAVEKLQALVHSKATIIREGKPQEIAAAQVVAGDVLLLDAGDIIAADGLILECNDLHVNESALTGESFPVEKSTQPAIADAPLSQVRNGVFKGTSVVNGSARVLAVHTAANTELGKITASLEQTGLPTAFEQGIQRFGFLLMRITVILAGLILVGNLLFHKPVVDSLLFALALAVGLAPELLPAIVTITLSAGARRMAAKKVIVKKLNAIENLGAIDLLCSDKTGTLTEGTVQLDAALDIEGRPSSRVLLYACLNASFESGFSNPVDEALRAISGMDLRNYKKSDEVPYDFIRKRLSIVVNQGQTHTLITKGAWSNILEICTRAEKADGQTLPLEEVHVALQQQFEGRSSEGYRVLGLCYKDVTGDPVINKEDETGMTLLGFLVLSDPPKKDVVQSIEQLRAKGISLKIITGDNRLVAAHLAGVVGLGKDEVLSGADLLQLTEEALRHRVQRVNVFAEIVPAQKERIVKALQQSGRVVGYLGDGINDATALRAADVGISISNAVDVAREAADLILLDKHLNVIGDGVEEGRKTFSNTLKYIYVTTSANFGNMISMALASLLLPFLPLLPVQILLNNFLSDLPALAIASDRVDPEQLQQPRGWNVSYIRRFMLVFGIQSSLFDFATFGLLLLVFHTSPELFRTAWFMESLLTQILILLVIRTPQYFFKSRPSVYLLLACGSTFLISLLLPYIPGMHRIGLLPLPLPLLGSLLAIVAVYIVVAEVSKTFLMKRMRG